MSYVLVRKGGTWPWLEEDGAGSSCSAYLPGAYAPPRRVLMRALFLSCDGELWRRVCASLRGGGRVYKRAKEYMMLDEATGEAKPLK